LLQEKKPIPAIDEFVLRGVAAGLHNVGDVGGILGLDARLTQDAIMNQLDAGAVSFDVSTARGRSLDLTSRGQETLRTLVVMTPTRRAVPVTYDRLTLGLSAGSENLARPRDVECASLPARSKEAPKAQELSIDKLAGAIARAEGGRAKRDPLADFQLLDIRHVVRAERRYRLGVLLLYERNATLDYGIAVDGRASRDHTAAVGELGGLTHLGIDQRRILEDAPREVALAALPSDVRPLVARGPDVEEFRKALSERLALPAQMRGNAEANGTSLSRPEWPAREVTAWEQALLFGQAVRTASRRLLISSPTVAASSVDYALKGALEDAALRGAEVDVIVRRRPSGDPKSAAPDPLARLREATGGSARIRLHEVDEAVDSVLLWDDAWIAGAFPWLAQSGKDAGLMLGTGVLVTDQAAVSATYANLMERTA
jgi:hypothetical protein